MDSADAEQVSPDSASISKSDQVRAMLANGVKPGEIAKKVGCSRNLVYLIKNAGAGSGKQMMWREKSQATRQTADTDVDDIVAAVQSCGRDVVRMRAALEDMRAIVNRALG